MAVHQSKITINIGLDDNKVPQEMTWSAPDGGIKQQETKAVLLSVWDGAAQEALRIDLWTKTMPLDEMKVFFHQTLSAMADTFERATNDDKMSATMRDFWDYFAEKMDLKNPKK